MVLDHEKLLEAWLAGTCFSASSRVTYERLWRSFAAWADGQEVSLTGASRAEVIEWAQGHGVRKGEFVKKVWGDRYRRKRLMVMRSWFGFLEDNGIGRPLGRWRKSELRAFRVDDRAVLVACEARSRTALTRAEARRVWRWCVEELTGTRQLAVGLMLVGGLRAVEVSRLDRGDVADEGRKLTVEGKGGKTRVVFFEGRLAEWLEKWAKGDGVAPGVQAVYRVGKEAWRQAGRERCGSSHGLRRSAATLRIERGATIDQVQDLLGHASAATTVRCYVVRRSKLPGLGIGR